MKIHIKGLLAAALCFTLASVQAQPGRGRGMGGGPGNGPRISGAMAKLFGENTAFAADLENEMHLSQGNTVTMPGKINFDSGKARFEMNMSEAKGNAMPPQAIAQMKSMGMDSMTSINRPDLKISYLIYPGLKAYAEMPSQDSSTNKTADYKIETTEEGKETIDGHPAVKNKVVVTDDQGKAHNYTVWNATDLKNFPVKIETAEEGMNMTMSFKNVKFGKQSADLFNAPSDYKKYDNVMSLMQQEMMKKMQENGGGMGMPPNHP